MQNTTTTTTTTTSAPDWGIAYCRGECLGWVGLHGQPGDDFLDGHYASQGEAEVAMNADLELRQECEYIIDCADLREEMMLEELEG